MNIDDFEKQYAKLMNNMPKLRITSTGPTGNLSKVYLNGEQIKYCQQVVLDIRANTINRAMLVLAVGEIEIDTELGQLLGDKNIIPVGNAYGVIGTPYIKFEQPEYNSTPMKDFYPHADSNTGGTSEQTPGEPD